ncbi:MAG: glutamate-5-semialdehyde dehydrogenase [Chloroflexota bacterium]
MPVLKSAVLALEAQCRKAKEASRRMAYLPTDVKNRALEYLAQDLITKKDEILSANKVDLGKSKKEGLAGALYERLRLNPAILEGMAHDVMAVVALPDPVGEVFDMKTLPNGLIVGRKRVPLGVIATVYESRPNVTTDISALSLKSGNAVILRGGREALNSNRALAHLVQGACAKAGVPQDAVQFIENTDHALVDHLLRMNQYIDLIVPRGGTPLITFVRDNASIPVVAGGIGVNHTYVDKAADIEKAVRIIYNAKVQKPSVCNALDCVLCHKDVARKALPLIAKELAKGKVELHCDERSLAILKSNKSLKLLPATDKDWGKEYLDLIVAVKVVDSIDAAMSHMAKYGTGHSEAIVTEDYQVALRFLNEVDAACVYVNASTRFTDGGQFGLGAEVGISTQKMHARGPMGLREITSYKWLILGSGQVRS